MQVRGEVLFRLRQGVDHDYGSEGYAQWLDSLPPSSRQAVGPYLDVNKWYPAEDGLSVPLLSMCRLFCDGDLEGAREFGRRLFEGMGLGRRALLKLEHPEKAVAMEARRLPSFIGPGEVDVPLAAPYMTIVRLRRFEGLGPVLEAVLVGYLERAAEGSGGVEARCQVSPSADLGPRFSDLVVTWC